MFQDCKTDLERCSDLSDMEGFNCNECKVVVAFILIRLLEL
jgi:hypothetical protein